MWNSGDWLSGGSSGLVESKHKINLFSWVKEGMRPMLGGQWRAVQQDSEAVAGHNGKVW